MNADHEQGPPSRSANPMDDPWILIDDAAEVEPPPAGKEHFWAASTWGEQPHEAATPPEPPEPAADPQDQGWDSVSSAGTWNGMRAAAPGRGADWGIPEYDDGQSRPDDTARDTWFVEDDLISDYTDDSDDTPATGRIAALTDRLPRLGAMTFGPAFVTFAVTCGSILLIISSIIGHPHVP